MATAQDGVNGHERIKLDWHLPIGCFVPIAALGAFHQGLFSMGRKMNRRLRRDVISGQAYHGTAEIPQTGYASSGRQRADHGGSYGEIGVPTCASTEGSSFAPYKLADAVDYLTMPFKARIKENAPLWTGRLGSVVADPAKAISSCRKPLSTESSACQGVGKTPDSKHLCAGTRQQAHEGANGPDTRLTTLAVSFFPQGNFQTTEPGSGDRITRPLNHLSAQTYSGDGVLVPRHKDSRAKATTAESLPEMGRRRKANYG